ncbi:hypothetical protein PUN28_006768 [Cardiocondyla obscurior]|uniref:Uncharacterized protein n=1 Tax=Cardiocondyla obscurior TaxID=286306 RepID=A0AAW2G1C1_9HYME
MENNVACTSRGTPFARIQHMVGRRLRNTIIAWNVTASLDHILYPDCGRKAGKFFPGTSGRSALDDIGIYRDNRRMHDCVVRLMDTRSENKCETYNVAIMVTS